MILFSAEKQDINLNNTHLFIVSDLVSAKMKRSRGACELQAGGSAVLLTAAAAA